MRSRWLWIALSLGLIAVVWGGWSWVSERRFRNELMEANREMASGLHQLARQHLVCAHQPTERWDQGRLSTRDCARKSSATSTPPRLSCREFPRPAHLRSQAALARARLLMNTGRFAPAETLLLPILRERGPEAEQARNALQLLYHVQGRTGEIRELIDQSWANSGDAASLLTEALSSRSFRVSRRPCAENARECRRDRRPGLARQGEPGGLDRSIRARVKSARSVHRTPAGRRTGLARTTRPGAVDRRSRNRSSRQPVIFRSAGSPARKCSSFERGWPLGREMSTSSRARSLH